jgi:Ca-activated chloride channel family protein
MLVATLGASLIAAGPPAAQDSGQERFSFRTGVELVNVTATVVDEHGRFVSGLTANDFVLYEDGVRQSIQQFESERVPVSLGIALDTSGSMLGEKIEAAQAALNRFLFDLLGPDDEVFVYRFDSEPHLVHRWTQDRRAVARALGTIKPTGGTAIYDTVAEAVPLAQAGTRRKKALVVISDGNDTSSRMKPADLVRRVRETEVLVYAIGIDASGHRGTTAAPGPTRRVPGPGAFPGRTPPPPSPAPAAPRRPTPQTVSSVDRINPDALRAITDDTGGRTEIIVSPADLDPATAGIADELSRQYFLGYHSTLPKDGRWHELEVRLAAPGRHSVRARRGFVAN